MAKKIDYELTEPERRLLDATAAEWNAGTGARALGDGATVDGSPFRPGATGDAAAGAAGGRFGARFLRPRTAESSVEVGASAELARERVTEALESAGEQIDNPNGADNGSIWGLVGSGARNLSPALVCVQIDPAGPSDCHVTVRATGNEGLIKQRIGAKAADRIVEAAAGG